MKTSQWGYSARCAFDQAKGNSSLISPISWRYTGDTQPTTCRYSRFGQVGIYTDVTRATAQFSKRDLQTRPSVWSGMLGYHC